MEEAAGSVEFRYDKRAIRRAREAKTIAAMLRLYCRAHHAPEAELCPSCRRLCDYAERRLASCPFGDAKPVCNKCPVHCYSAQRREQIRVIMRWAGPRMLRYRPLMAIRHLLDGRRPTPRLPEKKKNARQSDT